jgi:pimeloyl-ACP methyl ester carboxylesterase
LIPYLLEDNNNTTTKIRVIALDWLGSGLSDKPLDRRTIQYTFRNQGKILADFLQVMGFDCVNDTRSSRSSSTKDHHDHDKLILVGHSAAGMVLSSTVSIMSPYTVHGLCLIAPGFFYTKSPYLSRFPWWGRYQARKLQSKLGVLLEKAHLHQSNLSPSIQQAFARQWHTPNAIAVLEEMVIAQEPPYEQTLSLIPEYVPLHIIWSQEDTINPFAAEQVQAYFVQSQSPKSPPFTYTLLSGSGHYIQHELPQQLAIEIKSFVAKLYDTKQ